MVNNEEERVGDIAAPEWGGAITNDADAPSCCTVALSRGVHRRTAEAVRAVLRR